MLPVLVSSRTCPFVQRAVIPLEEKAVEHEVKYVDLANKPEWFLEKSPNKVTPSTIRRGTLSEDGSRFGLADVAVAPAFTRLAFCNRVTRTAWSKDMPDLAAYAERLLARPAITRSVPEDFETILRKVLSQKKSWMMAQYG